MLLTQKEIGERLVKLRGGRNQIDVAKEIGINATTLANYESGIRTPRDETKVLIAQYYDTTVQELFFE